MKKILLTLFAALLMPVLALAQANMGISKAHNTYSNNTTGGNTETQVTVPYRVAAGHDMPAEQDDSYSVGAWFKLTAWPSTAQSSAVTNDRACVMRLGTTDHVNLNGNFVISVLKNSGQIHITGHGGTGQGGVGSDGIKFSGTIDAGIQLNQWYHMVLSVDNANNRIALYLNGENIKEVAITTPMVYGGTLGWADGVFGFADFCFSGVLDEVQFWNHGLSDSDVLRAYKNASDVEGLTGLYTFSTAATSWPNEAPDAMEGTEAVYNLYTGKFQDGGVNDCSHAQATTAPTLVDGRENFCTLTIDAPEGVTATIAQGTSVITDLSTIVIGKEYYATFSVPAGKCVSSVKLGETVLTEQGGKYPFTLDGDATLTVELADAQMFTVNIVQPANGTITVSIPNATGSLTAIASGASLSEGTVLTLSNTPDAGYTFQNYVVNGANYGSNTITVSSDLTISAAFEEGIEYCVPTYLGDINATTVGETVNNPGNGRGITSIVFTNNTTGDSKTLTCPGTSQPRDIYKDGSGNPLTINPGDSYTIKANGSGTWMHTFIYLDANLDGLDANDAIHVDPTTGSQAYDRTFTFTMPEDILPGTHRLRYVVDWDNNGPCTVGQSGKFNGELVADFDFYVPQQTLEAPRTVAVETENTDYGTIAITSPATEESSVSTDAKAVTIAATAAEGYAFMNWTDADGNVVSTDAVYTYTGTTDATFTANFGVEITYTAGEGGSLEVTAGGAAVVSGSVLPVGAEIYVVATPDADYRLVAIAVNGEAQEGDEISLTADQSMEITATFTDAAYTLTINKSDNGEVAALLINEDGVPSPIANGAGIKDASDIYLKILPDEGYTIASLNIAHVGNFGTTDGIITLDNYQSEEVYDPGSMASEGYPNYDYYISTSGDVVVTVVFAPDNVEAIDGIYADGFDENAPVEYYNLQGVRVAAENLAPGFYIARQGAKAKKVLVTK